MQTKVIKIGTSKGVILSKKLLEQMHLQEGDMMEVDLRDGEIVLRKEDDLDREIDAYFATHGQIDDSLVWKDSDAPDDLKEDWVWLQG